MVFLNGLICNINNGGNFMNLKIVSNANNIILMRNSENNIVRLSFAAEDNKEAEDMMLHNLLSTYEDRVSKEKYLSNKNE